MANISVKKLYDSIIAVPQIDEDVINQAKDIFKECKRKGIIVNSEFEDKKWMLTDEYSNIGIVFTIPEFEYQKYYHDIWNLKASDFILYAKAFVMLLIGKLVLATIRTFIYDLRSLIKCDPDTFTIKKEPVFLNNPSIILDFIELLPEPTNKEIEYRIENIMEWLVEQKFKAYGKSNQRELADFNSYFLFNDILEDYWKKNLSKGERMFYYPLYLWWRITGVIPLRPREFLLTPRNCLRKNNGKYYLTLRRNNLKGTNKSKHYNIEQDYFTVEYEIPENLANEIQTYLDFTKEYESTELDTLFIVDTHYNKWNQKKHDNSRFFTYVNMNTVLRYFFDEVIQGQYGIKVVYDKYDLTNDDSTIMYMHLGDSRHLAFINIIAEGGTPVLTMILGGHNNMETAANYYTNISELIKCKTYRQYKKTLKGSTSNAISLDYHPPMIAADSVTIENGGHCYSQKFIEGDFSDCLKIAGPNGEIGDCTQCPYYRKVEIPHFYDDDCIYRRKMEEASKHLKKVIDTARLVKDNQEDIISALMKLRSAGYEYQQYLIEKYRKEEKNNG